MSYNRRHNRALDQQINSKFRIDLSTENSRRFTMMAAVIILLEIIINSSRIVYDDMPVLDIVSLVGMVKITVSIGYILIYNFMLKKNDEYMKYADSVIFVAIFIIGMCQAYLTYDEISLHGTIYNMLYLFVIIGWGLIYPLRVNGPIFLYLEVLLLAVIFMHSSKYQIHYNLFASLVFLIIGLQNTTLNFNLHKAHFTNEQMLEMTSEIDHLTNLYNRRGLESEIKRLTRRFNRYDDRVGVIMMDLDKFKQFNDNYGHKAGDSCLTEVSNVLLETGSADGEVVARFGGEEFICVIFGKSDEYVLGKAERIVNQIQALNIKHEYNSNYDKMTISAGVYCADKTSYFDLDLFVRKADEQMYKVKDKGGNGVESVFE